MQRRTVVMTGVAGMSIGLGGYLWFNNSASNKDTIQQVSDVKLTEIRDFGGPVDDPNPHFTFKDYFGATADLGDRMVLMSSDGDVVWESQTIDTDFSFRGNFLATSDQYYIYFLREEKMFVRAFDPDTGAERWTHKIVDRDTRELKEIVTTDTGIYYLTTANHSDQNNQRPSITSLNSEGSEQWSIVLQDEGFGRALIAYKNDLYVGMTRTVLKLDAQSGEISDSFDISPSHRGFTQESTNMYVHTTQGLLKFNLENDEIMWHNKDARDLEGGPVVAGDLVVVTSKAGWIDAYKITDGNRQWEVRLDAETRSLAQGENIVWTTVDDVLYAFNLATGKLVYEQDDGQYRRVTTLGSRIAITDYDETALYEVEELSDD